jgi:pyruvate/2-oxoglutarate dehydrogenase complex dihydrolipoamide acyltransferase (E2) component
VSETFLIDVPMPSMGATVNELTVVGLKVAPGDRVAKNQKLAELESDKSVFDFESPAEGTVTAIFAAAGEVKPSGTVFIRMEVGDASLRHLEAKAGVAPEIAAAAPKPAVKAQWTPRAVKLAQEAGLDPATISDIEATGPGGRISGDDLTRYLAKLKRTP